MAERRPYELTHHNAPREAGSSPSQSAELTRLRADVARLTQERDEARAECDARKEHQQLLVHKIITCGVAASHPNANLTREKTCYAETWNSPQAEAVRTLRDRAEQAEAECAALRARVWMVESALTSAVAILDGEMGNWREHFHPEACVIDAALAPERG